MTFSKGYIYIIQIFRVRGENRSGFVLKKKKFWKWGNCELVNIPKHNTTAL